TIDVHRKLQGTGVDALTAWEILGDPAEVIDVAGCRALRLPEAARALYIVLHAAHHGRAWGKALVHLEKALDLVEGPVWQHASDLAARLDALDAFVVGLRLLPKGTELASALELRSATSAEALLHSETPPPTALGFAQLAKAASTRERAAIAARKMFPPPAFIRHWWTPARRSRRMLIIGYAYRQLWLVTHARRGLPAWLRARQRARR
ncbi:MAG TPA: hypothetical protein VFP55_05020, partial [Solirubrobacteraceae bacterium]|nr:hypothetical protein [Solirubrobacteraceae bacterium]